LYEFLPGQSAGAAKAAKRSAACGKQPDASALRVPVHTLQRSDLRPALACPQPAAKRSPSQQGRRIST